MHSASYLNDRMKPSSTADYCNLLCTTVSGGANVGYSTRAPPVPVGKITATYYKNSAAMSDLQCTMHVQSTMVSVPKGNKAESRTIEICTCIAHWRWTVCKNDRERCRWLLYVANTVPWCMDWQCRLLLKIASWLYWKCRLHLKSALLSFMKVYTSQAQCTGVCTDIVDYTAQCT